MPLPLLDKEDLSANSYMAFVDEVLLNYGKNRGNILFLVGDNCNVNKALSRKISIPLIGCASHRLNLAIDAFLAGFEPKMDQIHSLMKKLSTIKGVARLTKLSPLVAVKRKNTRWSSSFEMLRRFLNWKVS